MRRIYTIVLYYDKKGTVIYREVNVLFANKEIAHYIGCTICEKKQLYFKLKEYIL